MTQSAFNKERSGTGTKEWSDKTVNIGTGCAHGCKYCYAMGMAKRFKRVASPEEWMTEAVNLKKVQKRYQSNGYVYMFPSAHDITPYYLSYATETLKKMLAAGNKVLIVSKPHLECIEALCSELEQYKAQILYRFTIGTLDSEVSKFWEPGAPLPTERIEALKLAYLSEFSTSVSMEPMLGGVDEALQTFKAVSPYVTETIWFGKMNQRVNLTAPEDIEAFRKIKELQRDSEILRLVSTMGSNQKVAWKDSIKEVVKKQQGEC